MNEMSITRTTHLQTIATGLDRLAEVKREVYRRSDEVMKLSRPSDDQLAVETRDFNTLRILGCLSTVRFWRRHLSTPVSELLDRPFCPFCGERCVGGWPERYLSASRGACGSCSPVKAEGNWRDEERA